MPRRLSRRAIATIGIVALLWWIAALVWGLPEAVEAPTDTEWLTLETPGTTEYALSWAAGAASTFTLGAALVLVVMMIRGRQQVGSWVAPAGLVILAGLTVIQAYRSVLAERFESPPATGLLYGVAVMLVVTAVVLAVTAWFAPRTPPPSPA